MMLSMYVLRNNVLHVASDCSLSEETHGCNLSTHNFLPSFLQVIFEIKAIYHNVAKYIYWEKYLPVIFCNRTSNNFTVPSTDVKVALISTVLNQSSNKQIRT